ncbi:MAG: GGDEF domain-containing protein [Actinomycetota bacterium]|nr:GGDEF domain-containing protein [Actinomycetota bacterium]
MYEFGKYFGKSQDPVLVIDSRKNTAQINSAMYNLLDAGHLYSSEEKLTIQNVKSLLLKAITDKEKASKLAGALEDVSLESFRVDAAFKNKGQDATFSILVSPLTGAKGEAVGKIFIFRELTEYIKLLDAFKEQSIRDFLTGAYNQRFFYSCLYREIKRFDRYKNPFCLLMADIDNLKKINDTYGHLKGDVLLKDVASILMANIREGIDYVARYGGDEFTVILVNTNIGPAKEIAERITENYNELKVEGTSLSVGICQYQKGLEADGVIKKADGAMYEAKKSGRGLIKLCSIP